MLAHIRTFDSTPCRAYGYDNWSNQFVSQANVVTRHSFTPAAASNFDAANRLMIQSSTYDPAGNQTAIGGYTFTYDAENRLKTSTINSVTTTFAYDGEGRRLKKGNEIYVYDAFGNLAAEYGGTPNPAGTQYLTTDHLGSTRLITKADGAVDQRIDYLPFGKAIPNGVSSRATGQGYQTNNYLDPLKPGFTGKDRDGETGLDYFLARYYSAPQGRFTATDPESAGASLLNPQSWNAYTYALNNPLKYVDPDGEAPVLVTGAIGAGIGAAGGAGFNFVSQWISSGGDFSQISGKQVISAALGGAVQGGLAGLTLGVGTAAVGIGEAALANGAANVIGGIVTRGTNDLLGVPQAPNAPSEVTSAATDFVMGAGGGGFGARQANVRYPIPNRHPGQPAPSHHTFHKLLIYMALPASTRPTQPCPLPCRAAKSIPFYHIRFPRKVRWDGCLCPSPR